MKNELIKILRENARMPLEEIASRLSAEPVAVAAAMDELEKEGVICGYTVVLNEAMLPDAAVKALIEVKITPRREGGFDSAARRIAKFPEVTDLILVSGSFDLLLTVTGRSLQEVANFVAAKLATIDGVLSTSTGFMLRKYKESGKIMQDDEDYERLKVCF